MGYEISYARAAAKAMGGIARSDPTVFGQIADAIDSLSHDPRPLGCAKLTGREAWRIRVRTYRVIYTIDDGRLTVAVVKVAKRGEAYR